MSRSAFWPAIFLSWSFWAPAAASSPAASDEYYRQLREGPQLGRAHYDELGTALEGARYAAGDSMSGRTTANLIVMEWTHESCADARGLYQSGEMQQIQRSRPAGALWLTYVVVDPPAAPLKNNAAKLNWIRQKQEELRTRALDEKWNSSAIVLQAPGLDYAHPDAGQTSADLVTLMYHVEKAPYAVVLQRSKVVFMGPAQRLPEILKKIQYGQWKPEAAAAQGGCALPADRQRLLPRKK